MFLPIALSLLAPGVWTASSIVARADDPDPAELLRLAADAVEANDAAIYHVDLERRGTNGSLSRVAEAEVWTAANRYARFEDGVKVKHSSANMFYVEGIRYERDGRRTVLRAASDGVARRVLDTERKVVWQAHAQERSALGSYVVQRLAGSLLINPTLLEKFARQDMSEGDLYLTYDGIEAVDGVPCHRVIADWVRDLSQILGAEGVAELPEDDRILQDITELWIGAEDHLPRRWDMNGTITTVSRLRATPPISRDIFRFDVPFGYELRYYGWEERAADARPGTGVRVGEPAPAWTLVDLDGGERSLRDFVGKVVLLDFWGTWCLPCKRAMPHLQEMHERFPQDEVVIVGLSCNERDGRAPAEYLRSRGYTYLGLLEADAVAESYGVEAYPTVVVVDRAGTVAFRGAGIEASREAEAAIEALLEDGE